MNERTLLPRICPGCGDSHPPLRTCAGGGNPWNGEPVIVSYSTRVQHPGWITLSALDLVRADEYAEVRVANHEEVGSRDVAGLVVDREERLSLDRDGVLGEMAVAAWLGVPYEHSKGAFKLPDVGPAFVRSTRHRGGHLIYRPADPPGPYVLVVDQRPDFTVPGWIHSSLARLFPKRRPDRSRPAAHLIAQRDLRPLPRGAEGIRALATPP